MLTFFNKELKCIHSTQKPVSLLEYLISAYTKKDDIVLDNCFGSCSTGVACANTNRRFIGIEMDNEYFSMGKLRVELAYKK
ncbi:site-specific DNA-methyltransferase [Metaclostridioides mangenotii]|uniref:site-specific DNA-methyltransferase n=1 Tax=Metaclostridioides mangenotii TaxID=1540 RepID=UPI0028ECF91B|nr:site-specific DNA-methyltransferase [Clostridioides mangenotii]